MRVTNPGQDVADRHRPVFVAQQQMIAVRIERPHRPGRQCPPGRGGRPRRHQFVVAAIQEQRRRVEMRAPPPAPDPSGPPSPLIASTRVAWIVSGSLERRTRASRLSLAVTLIRAAAGQRQARHGHDRRATAMPASAGSSSPAPRPRARSARSHPPAAGRLGRQHHQRGGAHALAHQDQLGMRIACPQQPDHDPGVGGEAVGAGPQAAGSRSRRSRADRAKTPRSRRRRSPGPGYSHASRLSFMPCKSQHHGRGWAAPAAIRR